MTTTEPPIERVLAALGDSVRKAGNGWQAKCPAHDDRNASLSVSEARDGTVLIKCHAGCKCETVVSAMNLTMRDLFPPRENHNGHANGNGQTRKIAAIYDYRNDAGELQYQSVRYDPKDFRQRRPDGNGGWIWNLDGVKRVPFRLPELLNANENDPRGLHVLVEGEKDAIRLASEGFTATCNVGGAGKWKGDYNPPLFGCAVVIIADKDTAGRNHAGQVAASLHPSVASVKVLELPGENVKDASDWFDAGGTAEQLRELIEAARVWKPPGAMNHAIEQVASEISMHAGLVLTRMDGVQRIPVEWLWQYRLAMKKLNLFYGDPDVGKSTLATYLISQVSRGGEWPDGAGNAPLGTSFVMTFEDGIADTFGPRLDAAGADSSKVIALSMIRFLDENGKLSERAFTMDMVKHLSDAVDKFPDRKLVVIDPPSSCMPEGVNENSNSGVRGILTPWARFAEEKGVCVLFITHRPKAGTAKAVHGALGSLAWLAAVRSAFMLAKDKDDPQRRLFLRAKCNLAPPVPNLAYRIAGPVAHIEWLGAVETTADDVSRGDADPGRPGPDPKKLEAATDWLSAELADFQEHKVTDLKDSAKAAGVSWRTVQRASTKMGVKVHRASFGAGYVWRIPKP